MMKQVRIDTVARTFCAFALLVASVFSPATLLAQGAFPSKPIQLVVPSTTGSATDLVARILADKLGPKLDTQVLVVDKPGAGGMLGADMVAKAAPDGYTLLLANPGLATSSFLYSKAPYNTARDFAGVGLVGESPYVVIVTPELGVTTIQELVTLARSKPKSVRYATGGLGTAMHLNCELLASRAGVELEVVPYTNGGAIATDFMSNRIQMMCVPIPAAMQFLRAGKAIPLGVTSAAGVSNPFQAPSIRGSTGLDVTVTNWNGVFAPVKTPEAVMQVLSKALKEVLADPELQRKLKEFGMSTNPIVLKEFDDYFRRELETWGPVVKSTGLKLD